MRVLMLSWEYPPLVVGGLGRHVDGLARALAAGGCEVCVITRSAERFGGTQVVDGVRVVRVGADPLAIDFTTESLLAWSQAADHTLLRAALPTVRRWRPDVIHAHDWLVAQSALTLAETTRTPLVTTLHATEAGRHRGTLPKPLNAAIHSVERWLALRSTALITCSTAMRDEVATLFDVSPHSVDVIPNGIDASRWRVPAHVATAARARLGPDAPLLAFAGRLVHEKGVQTLLSAVAALRAEHPGLRLLMAGTGPHEAALRVQARRLRIARALDWLGFVPEPALPPVLAAADAVVVPSFYEPFGLVALEAAVAGTPLVVARTGGLRDLATAGIAAASFPAGDVPALRAALGGVLADPASARRAARHRVRRVARDYSWAAVAERTVEVYERAGRSVR